MFENLFSLRGFQPHFYTGGPSRFHLPFFYDLVAGAKPQKIVTFGFGDGQAHFTFCQAAREQAVAAHAVAIRRMRDHESETDDRAWTAGVEYGQEFYGDVTRFATASLAEAVAGFDDGSVDLLLLDDTDYAGDLTNDLDAWEPKLAPDGFVLIHGAALERADNLQIAWTRWAGARASAAFADGIGLGVSSSGEKHRSAEFPLARIFAGEKDRELLIEVYRLAVARIAAQARADEAVRAQAAMSARQIWLDSLLADRWKAQEVMDDQARSGAELDKRFQALLEDRSKAQLIIDEQAENLKVLRRDRAKAQLIIDEQVDTVTVLRRDRAKAQLVMDSQHEQLKNWTAKADYLQAERVRLKAEVKEQRKILKAAQKACRKKGRCFQVPGTPTEKKRRSIAERILREIKRAPGNLFRERDSSAATPAPSVAMLLPVTAAGTVDRYAGWIAEHEPDAAMLKQQTLVSESWTSRPKISLLLPVLDPPVAFLEEMLTSIVNQTYGNWELCLVDAGSTSAEVVRVLDDAIASESRIRFERLPANLGIAENTNRALKLASGDFIACIDHDDLLAPFALYELACAIGSHPEADILYSDEDRLHPNGERHSPFFKPEWSPEYLLSSMYLGHLTAYRRDLVEKVGGFRKEFDLSQDYDFALRATEQARAVCHVPHVLYHWREHPASGSAGGKPEARKTNLAALAAAMARRGLAADIIEYPSANRVRLKINDWPKVSIVIPTDSAERARLAVEKLPVMTSYPDYEIVIVTNRALAETLEGAAGKDSRFVFVRYDQPFNFSDKCNLGAKAAAGSRLVFFNDDVESGQPDWIQNLIEPLENPEIGAVSPKLLYATGKIQHAGLVTGVRGLVGTACHEWAGDSVDYTNFAQSMRDVSALSAACLAMRRDDFIRVGEFDAVNTPIAHSDLDLCFKVREARMRCVYTPFVNMIHRGHASIGAVEEEKKTRAREKASVFLLQRWAGYTCQDPYFPENVRDWLYADSPTPIQMWGRNQNDPDPNQPALLFVSHDLTWSGAPLILLQAAKWCQARGFFVVVMSPEDGPLREKFFDADIPVIVDPLIITGHPSFPGFAREFDNVIASTIFGAPIIRAAKEEGIPHLWWIHEGRVAEHYLGTDAKLRGALALAEMIVTPDTRSSQVYQPFSDRPVRVLSYGIPDPRPQFGSRLSRNAGPLKFLLLGTIEHRKGQEVFLEALGKLPEDVRAKAQFQIVGRPHDVAIASKIKAAAEASPVLTYSEGVSPEEALALIRDADVLVSSSWDETGPLILMEALALGTAILSTNVGAVAEFLSDGDDGLFFPPGDAGALATAIERLVREPELIGRLEKNGRLAYEKYFTFERFGREFVKLVREATPTRLTS